MKTLKGKYCLITGAASGIGRALAIGLAKEGMNLFISDIDEDKLSIVQEEIKQIGIDVYSHKCDVSIHEDFIKLKELFYSRYNKLDLLINNAGIGGGGFIESLEIADWKKVIDINLWSVIYSINVFIPEMIKNRSGHIVNVASGLGMIGLPFNIPYVASKFAIVGISEALYSELNDKGISISVICPTSVKTSIINKSVISIPTDIKFDDSQKSREEIITEFKKLYWKEYTKGGFTPKKAVKRYIDGIKNDKLFIFDDTISVPLGLFLKSFSQNIYKLVLRDQYKKHKKIIYSIFKELGIEY
ncbi:MAG: SDR family NAD(P)-dependent oxidoreductase [Candidatus Helarchaeota archaeon]